MQNVFFLLSQAKLPLTWKFKNPSQAWCGSCQNPQYQPQWQISVKNTQEFVQYNICEEMLKSKK